MICAPGNLTWAKQRAKSSSACSRTKLSSTFCRRASCNRAQYLGRHGSVHQSRDQSTDVFIVFPFTAGFFREKPVFWIGSVAGKTLNFLQGPNSSWHRNLASCAKPQFRWCHFLYIARSSCSKSKQIQVLYQIGEATRIMKIYPK